MKVLKQVFLVGGLVLIGVGVWIVLDKWYALIPLGFGGWAIYEVLSGRWFGTKAE